MDGDFAMGVPLGAPGVIACRRLERQLKKM